MERIRFVRAPLARQNTVLSFLSYKKKSNYNLSQLFNTLKVELFKLNKFNECHLTTYPYIGVHVVNRDTAYLKDNEAEIKDVVQRLLWESMQ